MKTYYPYYYDKFSCIADKCPDSCCKDWEIIIDDETYNNYIGVAGEFGEKIRSSLTTDSEGDRCFILKNGRCPFLNDKGLCDIHIALGEKMTSKICRDHPRFIEEYDGFKEIALSLSCPEASRIILSENPSHSLYPTPHYVGEDEVLGLLISSRARILENKKPFFESISDFTEAAARDEEQINLFYVESGYMPKIDGVRKFIKRLRDECEILSSDWKILLENALEAELSDDEFYRYIRNNEKQMLSIFYYYVYRYYLKSVNDLEVYPRALYIIFCVFSSALIAFSSSIPLQEAARLYSKEIEHSSENFDILFENICEY